MAIPVATIITGAFGALKQWMTGKQNAATQYHDEYTQAMGQFSAEFRGSTNWFDSLIDGLNRLPRPIFVFLLVTYFILSFADPERFNVINQGLNTVPESMWTLMLIVIGFYFAARELSHSRKAKAQQPPKQDKNVDPLDDLYD